ncbi:MAG: ribbon-helix-helix protein, CopG family [Cyanobacteria bacterium J06656_5]
MTKSKITQSFEGDSLSPSVGGSQRITVTLDLSSYEKLAEIAQEKNMSISEAVRRSIRRDMFIQSLLREKGGKLLMESSNGKEAYIFFDE